MAYSQENSGGSYKEGGKKGGSGQASTPPANIKIELYEGNDKNKIKLDLFDDQADNNAKQIVNEGNNKNQIRIFYNQFLVLNAKINNPDDFYRQLPYIKMIKARAKYSKGRGHIKNYFETFLLKCVDAINNLQDFKIICNFFEAVVGYATYYEEEKKKNHA
jgi:CRISPR type III-A-associated protein Csm2